MKLFTLDQTNVLFPCRLFAQILCHIDAPNASESSIIQRSCGLLQVAPLALAVSSFAAASFDRWIYVIGGGPNGKLATDTVQCWEPGTDSWETRAPIPFETKCTNAVSFKNCVYIVGGCSHLCLCDRVLSSVEFEQFILFHCIKFFLSFFKLPPLISSRWGLARDVLLLSSGRLLVTCDASRGKSKLCHRRL